MSLPIIDLKITTETAVNTPYSQIESGTAINICCADGDAVDIKCNKPLGIKFMGMEIATLSSIKFNTDGEVLEHQITAPFLVKGKVEDEIFKAVKRIPFALVKKYLMQAGISKSTKIEIKICQDGSVKVESDTPLKIAGKTQGLTSFRILQNGEIENENISLAGETWTKFQNLLVG